MNTPHLSCRDVIAFLERYLSGELPADMVGRFNAHLAACPSCVAYTQTYRETIRLSRHAHICEEAEPDVPEDLVRAILLARSPGSP